MRENKINILSTAMLNESLVEDLSAAAGMDIDVMTFIETKALDDAAVRASLKPYLHQFAVVVVTSSKAVEAIAANLQGATPGWMFYCIGHKTRQLVHKYFGGSSIAGAADNALELGKMIAGAGRAHDLLFFCGDQRRDELPDQLRAAEIEATEIIVYETKLTPKKIDRHYDAILFYSPSAVKSFFSINQVQPGTVLFSIGPTTGAELETHSTNKIIVADKPGKEEVLKKVIEYFNK
jgi:uroporphyrinogen-III synthase